MRYLIAIWNRLDESLRARIILPTVVLFAITLAGMVGAAVQLYGSDMERGLRERAELFTANVAAGVTAAMMQGKPAQVPQLLEVVAGHRSDLASISLIRPDGRVAYSTAPGAVGKKPWEHIDRFEKAALVDSPQGQDAYYAVIHPIPNAEACTSCHGQEARFNGWLDLRFAREPVMAAEGRLRRSLTFSAAVALLFLVAIAWWLLGREAVSPLRRLVHVMRRAEGGDLGVRADEGRPDELGLAARGFDATLTALRRSQAELEAFYRERMVRADRFAAVGEVATGLAHEIKNPLAGLSGALEVIAEDLGGTSRAEVVSEMRHQVQRLATTMESLLSFARPPKTRLREADINGTLEKVLFLIRQQHAVRGGAVGVESLLDGALPPVLADPGQLEQVFLNICLNACQAMDGRGGTLTVRSFTSEGRVQVEIQDTGPGIPAELRAQVFKPFFTTKREGNGLGLAISARIVADHGGTIVYRCPPGGGTIFAVALQTAGSAARTALAAPEDAA